MTVFCTENDVMLQVPIVAGFTSRYSPLIPDFISSVSEQIRTFCRRDFDKVERTTYGQSPDTLQSRAPYRVKLKESPIEPGTLFIYFDSYGLFTEESTGTTAELLEERDYTVDYPTGKVEIIAQSLCYVPRGLKYVYVGGYSSVDNVVQGPLPLKLACAMQVAFSLQRIAASQSGQLKSEDDRKDARTFSGGAVLGMLNEVQLLLAPYRTILTGRN